MEWAVFNKNAHHPPHLVIRVDQIVIFNSSDSELNIPNQLVPWVHDGLSTLLTSFMESVPGMAQKIVSLLLDSLRIRN